jgi:hypothetical protein
MTTVPLVWTAIGAQKLSWALWCQSRMAIVRSFRYASQKSRTDQPNKQRLNSKSTATIYRFVVSSAPSSSLQRGDATPLQPSFEREIALTGPLPRPLHYCYGLLRICGRFVSPEPSFTRSVACAPPFFGLLSVSSYPRRSFPSK